MKNEPSITEFVHLKTLSILEQLKHAVEVKFNAMLPFVHSSDSFLKRYLGRKFLGRHSFRRSSLRSNGYVVI